MSCSWWHIIYFKGFLRISLFKVYLAYGFSSVQALIRLVFLMIVQLTLILAWSHRCQISAFTYTFLFRMISTAPRLFTRYILNLSNLRLRFLIITVFIQANITYVAIPCMFELFILIVLRFYLILCFIHLLFDYFISPFYHRFRSLLVQSFWIHTLIQKCCILHYYVRLIYYYTVFLLCVIIRWCDCWMCN